MLRSGQIAGGHCLFSPRSLFLSCPLFSIPMFMNRCLIDYYMHKAVTYPFLKSTSNLRVKRVLTALSVQRPVQESVQLCHVTSGNCHHPGGYSEDPPKHLPQPATPFLSLSAPGRVKLTEHQLEVQAPSRRLIGVKWSVGLSIILIQLSHKCS